MKRAILNRPTWKDERKCHKCFTTLEFDVGDIVITKPDDKQYYIVCVVCGQNLGPFQLRGLPEEVREYVVNQYYCNHPVDRGFRE